MDRFYEWCDDKVQVIGAVLIITGLAMVIIPDKIDLNTVYAGLFGLAAGMGIARKG